jgi:hypothetical protein
MTLRDEQNEVVRELSSHVDIDHRSRTGPQVSAAAPLVIATSPTR